MSEKEYECVPTSEQSEPVQGFVVDTASSNNQTGGNKSTSAATKDPYAPEEVVLLDGCRRPVFMSHCPKCRTSQAKTRTRTYPTAGTWAAVAVSAVIFFPICWIPLVADSMKQTDHYCQTCQAKIGTVKALEGCCVKERS